MQSNRRSGSVQVLNLDIDMKRYGPHIEVSKNRIPVSLQLLPVPEEYAIVYATAPEEYAIVWYLQVLGRRSSVMRAIIKFFAGVAIKLLAVWD